MADGFNEPRALRVTEIMRDYQDIQRRIAAYNVAIPHGQQSEAGYLVLRQSQAEARTLLNSPYPEELLHPPRGPGEAQKRQLQRVIIDASVRRYQAQKIFLRATAAMKWINARKAILPGGQKPTNGTRAQLQQAENAMRAEIAQATGQRIVATLRAKDQAAGYWLQDDPSLAVILNWIGSASSSSSSSGSGN